MSSFVDVSDKSEKGIEKALDQIYAKFGIPDGKDYTVEQLESLVKVPNIQRVNRTLLSLLKVANKLQENKPDQLSLAIQQIKAGNIDDSLIKELGTFVLNNMPEEPPSNTKLDLTGVTEFLQNSGAVAPRLIEEEVKQMNEHALSGETTSGETTSGETTSGETTSGKTPAVSNYMSPTMSSKQKGQAGGILPIIIIIAVGLAIIVIFANREKIKNAASNAFNATSNAASNAFNAVSSCFGSKTTAGGKKNRRNRKSKRSRKSRRNRTSKRRQ